LRQHREYYLVDQTAKNKKKMPEIFYRHSIQETFLVSDLCFFMQFYYVTFS
jgi:Mn-dependent DtxR family transcriptional regulator